MSLEQSLDLQGRKETSKRAGQDKSAGQGKVRSGQGRAGKGRVRQQGREQKDPAEGEE